MLMTAARLLILSLVLYTGPAKERPADAGIKVITITIPTVIAANTPICAIS